MKKVIAFAAIGAAIAAPAFAADVSYPEASGPVYQAPSIVQAHVDLYGGFRNFDEDIGPFDNEWIFGGAGRINVPLLDGWNIQLDAQGSASTIDESGFSESFSEYGGFAHIYKRDPQSYALGFFAGADFPTPFSIYQVGVEGQLYWPQFTLYGQASFGSLNVSSESATAIQLRGEGKYFIHDNTALIGDIMWTNVSGDAFSGTSILSLSGSVMHRFDNTPLAGFLKARWDHATGDGDEVNISTFLAGIRIFADPPGSTLKSSGRTGPAMDVDTLLPAFFAAPI
jgi:opacity protein-like surface antigen